MKRKNQRKRRVIVAEKNGDFETAQGVIRALLREGKTRSALDQAKEWHKRLGSAESEALLIDAYLGRSQALMAQGMIAEGGALLDLARSRHPALELRREALLDLQALQGRLGDLVGPLSDSALSADERAAIEAVLRRRLLDPAELAACEALPAEHPLRRGAADVVRALRQAASSGPVKDEDIALESVSRRSPLAPWKLLARAIAAFHRGDDMACEQALAAMDEDSAPGRLVPLMRAMMAGQETDDPLAGQILGHDEELRPALEGLDEAFDSEEPEWILAAIRQAAEACRRERPDLEMTLRSRVSARAAILHAPFQEIRVALGGIPRRDAAFWILFARSHELQGGKGVLVAAIGWDRFLCHARAEGRITGKEETAAVYRRMAGLFAPFRWRQKQLESEQRDVRPFLARFVDYYKDQPEDVLRAAAVPKSGALDSYMVYPERLYERSCELDPLADTFREWLEWTRSNDKKRVDAVAEAWHRALPEQTEPLLRLMESARDRGALKKALTWLEKAERLDALSPEARRARWRILVATALGHLSQKKAHLVRKDIARMEAMEWGRQGDRPILLEVVRWLLALLEGDATRLEAHFEEAARRTGDPRAVAGAMEALSVKVRLTAPMVAFMNAKKWPPPSESLIEAFLRIGTLMAECDMYISVPPTDRDNFVRVIRAKNYKADAGRMVRLARLALKTDDGVLAHAATGVGLALGDKPETAELLLLRGLSLKRGMEFQSNDCLLGALVMARQRRDTALYNEALEEWRRRMSFLFGDAILKEDLEMDPRHLERVLAYQRSVAAYPKPWDFDEKDRYLADCPCDRCREDTEWGRAALGDNDIEVEFDEDSFGDEEDFETGAGFDGGLFEDEDEDEIFFDDSEWDLLGPVPKEPVKRRKAPRIPSTDELFPPDLSDLPPEAIPLFMELATKHARKDGTLPPIDEILEKEPEIAWKLIKICVEHAGYDSLGDFDEADLYGETYPGDPGGGSMGFFPPFPSKPSNRKSKKKKKKKKRK